MSYLGNSRVLIIYFVFLRSIIYVYIPTINSGLVFNSKNNSILILATSLESKKLFPSVIIQ